jgi:hypothetical protein
MVTAAFVWGSSRLLGIGVQTGMEKRGSKHGAGMSDLLAFFSRILCG